MTRYEVEVELTDEQARAVERIWPENCPPQADDPYGDALFALARAIRANPPKPPRMAEPAFGSNNVIAHNGEDPTRRVWVRQSQKYSLWTDGKFGWDWSHLIDPEPVDGAS